MMLNNLVIFFKKLISKFRNFFRLLKKLLYNFFSPPTFVKAEIIRENSKGIDPNLLRFLKKATDTVTPVSVANGDFFNLQVNGQPDHNNEASLELTQQEIEDIPRLCVHF